MKQLLFSLLVAGALTLNSQQIHAQCITALQLDGVDDYLNTSFDNYTFSDYTIEMWINSADYLANDIYVTWRQNTQVIFGGWAADGSFNNTSVGLSPIEANSGPGTTLNSGSWHHLALVYNGSERIYYIDGVAVNTVPTTGSLTTNSTYVQGLTIGARFDGSQQHTNTTFEDVRIWETARSAAEINSSAVNNLTGTETGLIAYYRFDDGPGSTTVTDLTGNGHDLTLMNMDPSSAWVSGLFSTSVQSTDIITNCGSYTWVDGNTYSTNNNTATHTFAGGAAGGCDSTVTLDLTIETPADNSLTTSASPVLSSNDISAGVSYQWIDCSNGNAELSGETNQDFTAFSTGMYGVIVTGANGCSDTSECFTVDFSSIDESHLISEMNVSPNPTNGKFIVSTSGNSGELSIRVTDLTGKVMYSSTEILGTNNSAHIDLTDVAHGVYVVHIIGTAESRSIRFLKK